ncbi:hypothetical protein ABZY90_12595 [Streptomyces sp. NPDC006422]|uniref:hypothetical protein n=1 Tax=unclassified Streptomyces TaxID=2593676 RepID=UPI0033AC21CA
MTEQERGGSERPDSSEPHEQEGTADGQAARDPFLPTDEDAAWAAIVAGYGEEPPDPPGAKPFKSVEDLALLEPETNDAPERVSGAADAKPGSPAQDKRDTDEDNKRDKASRGRDGDDARPLGSSVSFAPGIAATPGPRDHTPPEASDDDFDGDDEGHFVPPEPPPLPEGDVTAKFAWLAVVGGPVLLLLAVLLGWDMTWWLATLCIGGFLGGFATLVARMSPGDDDGDDDPGRGAVV